MLLWHYHDDDVPGPAATVNLTISGLPTRTTAVHVGRYCIDEYHSNSFAAWKAMGSPQTVSDAQYRELENAARLTMCPPPGSAAVTSGTATTRFELPRQAVSMVDVSWGEGSR